MSNRRKRNYSDSQIADVQSGELRKRSGTVDSSDPLVCFFYLLLRDKLSAGKVAQLLRETFIHGGSQFCNGYLANYAKDIAARFHAEAAKYQYQAGFADGQETGMICEPRTGLLPKNDDQEKANG